MHSAGSVSLIGPEGQDIEGPGHRSTVLRWWLRTATAALLLASASVAPAQAQTTKAQYGNQDGSTSPAVVIQCPDPGNAGKSYPCTLAATLGAGSAIIGKVGIDQTTPGTTNAVAIALTSAAAAGIAPTVSGALESNHVLKASPGNLYDFQANIVTCASTPCWVMLFDATALPSNGAVTPKKWWQVNANSWIAASWAPGPPLVFATGIVVGCSTTGPFTLTATAQCAISGEVQ